MKFFIGGILAPFYPYLLLLALLFAQIDYDSREFEFVGVQHSDRIISEIKSETNLKIPSDSLGLAYKYLPPIDPIVFAKLQLSEIGKDEFIKNLDGITCYKNFPPNFANSRCDWWKINSENLIFSKTGIMDESYFEVYILKENQTYYLYLKIFTI